MTASPEISGAVMRIRQRAPFFAALLLYARIEASAAVGTAATDGRTIYYNPDFVAGLPRGGAEAVLVHEVLHCALGHVHRRGGREPRLWNYAADIVVNGIISADRSYQLPAGAVRDAKLEHHSTEEVYGILLRDKRSAPETLEVDLLAPVSTSASNHGEGSGVPSLSTKQFWDQAIGNARLVAANADNGSGAGRDPLGVERFLNDAGAAQLDWRTALWRFLVRTPTDYSGYDRRFIHRGLYLDDIGEEAVRLSVVIDTSGSIDQKALSEFQAELLGILRSYPRIECELFYADADLYGPYELTRASDIPPPRGGGGTSFVPFFTRQVGRLDRSLEVAIYLTDGYGTFPTERPALPVLWVVSPGGLATERFPFGDVLRLIQ